MVEPVIYFDILAETAKQLREHVDLSGPGASFGIDTYRISRIPFEPGSQAKFIQSLNPPEVIVSPGRYIRIPEQEGTNRREDVYFPVLIQFVGMTDPEWFDQDTLKRELSWEQATRSFFINGNLRLEVFKPEGYVNKVIVNKTEMIDPNQFVVLEIAASAVALDVVVRTPRDSRGTV